MRRNYSEILGVIHSGGAPCNTLWVSHIVQCAFLWVLGVLWLWLCLGVSRGLFCSQISKLPGHLPHVPVSRLSKARLRRLQQGWCSVCPGQPAWLWRHQVMQGTVVQRWSTPTTQPVSLTRSQLTCGSRRRYLPSLRIEEGAYAKGWVFRIIWVLICCPICCVLPLNSQSLNCFQLIQSPVWKNWNKTPKSTTLADGCFGLGEGVNS